jgi:hypothetical protein
MTTTLLYSHANDLCLETLESGTTVNVQTDNSCYRLVVVDGLQHLVLISGGTAFPEEEMVRIAGATCNGTGLRPGRIIVGLGMELFLGRLRIKSSLVRALSIPTRTPGA